MFIYNWVKQQYKNNIRKMYEYDWNDYHCLVVNSSYKGSKQFEVVDNYKDYDLLVAWSFNGERFEYCMYTTKPNINCGVLCKMYLNGGGHPGAAGGNSKKLVFGDFKGNKGF